MTNNNSRAKFKVTRRQLVALATLSVVATLAQVSGGQFSGSRPFPAPAPHGYHQQQAQRFDPATSPTQQQVSGNIEAVAEQHQPPSSHYNEPGGAGRRRHQSGSRLVSKVKDKLSGKSRPDELEQQAERGRLSNFGSRIKNRVHGFSSKIKHPKQHRRNSPEPVQGFYMLNNHGPVAHGPPSSPPVSHHQAPPANGQQPRQPEAQYLPKARQDVQHSIRQHGSSQSTRLGPGQIATNRRGSWPAEVSNLAERPRVIPSNGFMQQMVPQMNPSEFNALNRPFPDVLHQIHPAKDQLSFHNQIPAHVGPQANYNPPLGGQAFYQMINQYPGNFENSITPPEAARQVYDPVVSGIPSEYFHHNQPDMDTASPNHRRHHQDPMQMHAGDIKNALDYPSDAQLVLRNNAPDDRFQSHPDQYRQEKTGRLAEFFTNSNNLGGLFEPTMGEAIHSLNDGSEPNPFRKADKFAAHPAHVNSPGHGAELELKPTHDRQQHEEHHSSSNFEPEHHGQRKSGHLLPKYHRNDLHQAEHQHLHHPDHNQIAAIQHSADLQPKDQLPEHHQNKHENQRPDHHPSGHHKNDGGRVESTLPGRKLPKGQRDHHQTEHHQAGPVSLEQYVDQQSGHPQPAHHLPEVDAQLGHHQSGHRLPSHHRTELHPPDNQQHEIQHPGDHQSDQHLPGHQDTNLYQPVHTQTGLLQTERLQSEPLQSELQQPSVGLRDKHHVPELPHHGDRQSEQHQHGYRLPRDHLHSEPNEYDGQLTAGSHHVVHHQVADPQLEHMQNGPHQNDYHQLDPQQSGGLRPELQQNEHQHDIPDQSEHYQAENQHLEQHQAGHLPSEYEQHEHRQPGHLHQLDQMQSEYDKPEQFQQPGHHQYGYPLPEHIQQLDQHQHEQQQPEHSQHQPPELVQHHQTEPLVLPEHDHDANLELGPPLRDLPDQYPLEYHQPDRQPFGKQLPGYHQREHFEQESNPVHAEFEQHEATPMKHLPRNDYGPQESLQNHHVDQPDGPPLNFNEHQKAHQPFDGPLHQDEQLNRDDLTHSPLGGIDFGHLQHENEAHQTFENPSPIPVELDQVAPISDVPNNHFHPVDHERSAGFPPEPNLPMHNTVDGNTLVAPEGLIGHDEPFDPDHVDNLHPMDPFDQHLDEQNEVVPFEQQSPLDSSIDRPLVDPPEYQHTNDLVHADDNLYADHNIGSDHLNDMLGDDENANLHAPSVGDFISSHRTGESIIEYDSNRKLEPELVARLPPKEAKPKCIGENCKIAKRKAIKLPKMFFDNMLSSVSKAFQGKVNQNPVNDNTNKLMKPAPSTPPEGAELPKSAPIPDETQIEDKSNTSDLGLQNLDKIKKETEGGSSKPHSKPMRFNMRGVNLRRIVPLRLGGSNKRT